MEAQRHIESAQEEALSLDLRRTLVLGRYLQAWSMREYRIVMTGRQGRARIEIYFFPPAASGQPARFATVGLSRLRHGSGAVHAEWMMALEEGLGGESVDRVCAYLCDLIAHSIENTDGAEPPRVMGASPLAPEKWTAKAILIDELRGESEALERIAVGSETVELQWVVPISQKEAALILDQGIDAFDAHVEGMAHSIIDPARPE